MVIWTGEGKKIGMNGICLQYAIPYDEDETIATYAWLAQELDQLEIAYLHIAVNAVQGFVPGAVLPYGGIKN